MRKLSYLLIIFLLVSSLQANEKIIFKKVRVAIDSYADMCELVNVGLDFDGAVYEKNRFVELIVSEHELQKIQASGFDYRVEIEDMSEFYASLLITREGKGFGYGSMGGFYTFEEVNAQLDSMAAQYPELITVKDSIGASTLGRPIYAVQIADNPGENDGEPEMLFTALHHAREPQGMMTVLYYMWHLLENYGTDAQVTDIVNNRKLWFIPVLNPDGYVHNQETDPAGGGMWRKNGRDNNNNGSNFDYYDGVDLNRNYGYEWGPQWSGSSGEPSSSTYRGPSGFSEPEIQVIRDFCNTHEFRAAVNYHTYSNLLLYPWGYDDVACEDDAVFAALAAEMTVINEYTTGRPANAIGYTANGSSDDWMYGEQVTKPKIFAFTPEVGGSYDGFWPATDRILPLAAENLYMNLYISRVIGEASLKIKNLDLMVYGQNNAMEPGETAELIFNLYNNGFESASGLTARIISEDTLVHTFDHQVDLPGIEPFTLSPEAYTLDFQLDYACVPGETRHLVVGIFDGMELVAADTLAFTVSAIEIISFTDNAESGMGNWTANAPWSTTGADYHSPSYSFTDSPSGEYGNSLDISLTSGVIDLQDVPNARLEYYTQWEIEERWDFAVVEISTDGGSSWQNLQGEHMQPGSGSGEQETSEYGYDGASAEWVQEEISLQAWAGEQVQIRFRMKTDGSVTYDGWYLDDIQVKTDSISVNKPPMIHSVTHYVQIYDYELPLSIQAIAEDDAPGGMGALTYTFDLETFQTDYANAFGNPSGIFDVEVPGNADTVYYYFTAIDSNGAASNFPYNCSVSTMDDNCLKTTIIRTTDIDAGEHLITEFKLLGNYPNPFNPETAIRYQLPAPSEIEFSVYNALGQGIRRVNIQQQSSGLHQLKWDGKDNAGRSAGSGVYFYRLQAGDNSATGKMILMK